MNKNCTQFLSYMKKAFPKSIRGVMGTVIGLLIMLSFLWVTGNRSQVADKLNWAIASLVLFSFTFVYRFLSEVLRQPTITKCTRILTITLFFVLCGGLFLFGYHGTTRRMDNAEIEELRSKSYYKDESLFLRNIVGTDGVIRNKTFEGCWIVGPVILYVDTGIYLEEGRNSLDLDFIIVQDNVSQKPGAIIIENCTFKDSWFENVAILGHKDEVERIRQNIVRR